MGDINEIVDRLLNEKKIKIIRSFELLQVIAHMDARYQKGTWMFQGKVRDVYDMNAKAWYQMGYSQKTKLTQNQIQKWIDEGKAKEL